MTTEADMTRDEMIREMRNRSASWKGIVIVYAVIVGVMLGSAAAIL
jgi:hypothetical protein